MDTTLNYAIGELEARYYEHMANAVRHQNDPSTAKEFINREMQCAESCEAAVKILKQNR